MPRATLLISGKDKTGIQVSQLPGLSSSSEPCCLSSSLPHATAWDLWHAPQTRSALSCLCAFAPAVPPAWHALPGSTLPGKLPPPSRGSGSVLSGSLTRITRPCSWVNFWYLLYCEIYVSASPFHSRLPEGKDAFLFISVSQQPAQGVERSKLSISVIA